MLTSSIKSFKNFAMHRTYPLGIVGDSENHPQIVTPEGTPFFTFNQISESSIFKYHNTLPIVAFGTQKGELITYQIF